VPFAQGFERVIPVTGSVPELASIDPWDGTDGVEVVEDEFSLDDIMAD
jgi:hypothetical protein